MRSDRLKWNEKYLKKPYSNHPAAVVKKYHTLALQGKALDIAAGNGRNALFLAENGFTVDAVDISEVALARLPNRHPQVFPICMDLDDFVIPSRRYNLIVNIRFLSRRLYPFIKEGLAPGGVLIFETYIEGPRGAAHGPSCHDYLLRENELLQVFRSLQIIFYQEKKQGRHGEKRNTATLVARKS